MCIVLKNENIAFLEYNFLNELWYPTIITFIVKKTRFFRCVGLTLRNAENFHVRVESLLKQIDSSDRVKDQNETTFFNGLSCYDYRLKARNYSELTYVIYKWAE